jgi:hypothetical protein
MSTLLLKKNETQVQHTISKIFISFKALLVTTTGSTLIDKIVSALTNGRTIDENYKTTWRGDEREEL